MNAPRHVVIVGGGIAGLSAAYALTGQMSAAAPLACTLIEAEPRLGGKILTEQVDQFIIEGGPDSFLSVKPAGIELCRSLGLADRLIGTNPEQRKTFVYSRGRLQELPEGLAMGMPTDWRTFLTSGLLSWPAKLRLGLEWLVPARRDAEDESLGAFFRRRLGDEALERLIEPLMTGIYAGDADQLSIQATFPRFPEMERTHGGILRAMRGAPSRLPGESPRWTPFVTLRGGLGELVRALSARLSEAKVLTGRRVSAIRRLEHARYEVLVDGAPLLPADALVLAIPAYEAARLLDPLDRLLAETMQGIPYASTATVTLGFRRQGFHHDLGGYGFVVPRGEGRPLLASTWTSSKWSHRAPADAVLIRSYFGGVGRKAVAEQSEADLASLARAELKAVMGVTEEPTLVRVYRWPQAMPQYLVGHLERLASIDERLHAWPGLFLTGAGYRGVGIPDCIRDGQATAEQVRAYFDKAPSRFV